MANTLSQMRSEIWGWTDTDSTRLDSDYIDRIVNGIIADLSRSADSLYNEYSDTFPTISDTSDYDISDELSNRFSRPFSMWYQNSSGEQVRINYLPPEPFEKKYEGSTDTDAPEHYTIYAGNIVLGPTPDDAYSITFKYYGYPADLLTTTATNEYLENLWDVILYGSLGEVCLFLIEDQRKPAFDAEYKERRRRFMIEQARARVSGYRPESHEPGWLEG